MLYRPIPSRAFRSEGPVLEINEGFLVGCDHSGPRPTLDRHVAHRHPAFHGEIHDGIAAIFDDVSGSARRPDLADDRQDDVLGGGTVGELARDFDLHVAGLGLDERLRGEHVLDLRRSDAVRQCAERSMGRGVAVAADDDCAGQREALFGTDGVNDALPPVEFVEVGDAEFLGVAGQRLDLGAAFRFGDALAAIRRRHVVVDDGEGLLRMADLAARQPQPLERLRARHLMDEMPVDIEQAGAVRRLVHQVVVPDLVVKRAGFRHVRCPVGY